ncbi:tripartite tricarboxylate transporter TctB family protein [Phreatobacter stygius]|uniref:Tripartite tricarboxylate transporter TctB family protein n=1 Tax=Phreatobacter stygius TaxID=1940610 RepID=A0A4D7AZH0_9HYPH|nr:tripartite tricarboxylate transporter TctB family protein [Phreatobacter stygius]QCI64173.1 tripartite tricarboxylate transporter TctB family protein [Phreatobacter stygius]
MISRFHAELATAAATAAFGLVIAVGATEFGIGWGGAGPEPGTFPFYIGLLITAASLGTLAQSAVQRGTLGQVFLTAGQVKSIIRFVLPFVAFVAVSVFLGLYVATALYMFGTLALQRHYRWPTAAAIALGLPLFLYLVLEWAFQVSLMKGPLEAALGL